MKFVGSADPFGDISGFQIPLFTNLPDNSLYVQKINSMGIVEAFLQANTDGSAVKYIENGPEVSVGEQELIHFKHGEHNVIGVKETISQELASLLPFLDGLPILQFQLAVFCELEKNITQYFDAASERIEQNYGQHTKVGWQLSQILSPILEDIWIAKMDKVGILFNRKLQHTHISNNGTFSIFKATMVVPDFLPKKQLQGIKKEFKKACAKYFGDKPIEIFERVILSEEKEGSNVLIGPYFFKTSEKIQHISDLRRSGTFARTHNVVEMLEKYTDFEIFEIDELLDISKSNNQVGWIVTDDDVRNFYRRLSEIAFKKDAPEIAHAIKSMLKNDDGD